ncbi:MAG: acetate--CoA ligase family protein, partial [Chitinivibrionia bacterium]|nr:acetate--CoA ligase family protein [Chitinivibrionia bacterium]
GVPVYDYPETAARLLAAMTRYGAILRRKAPVYTTYTCDRKAAEAIVKKHKGAGAFIPQDDVFAILEAYGIPAAKTARITNEGELAGAAKKIAYPLALKVDAESIVHKSDAGGVALGIADEQALLAAHKNMAAKFAKEKPAFILQQYMKGGKETILGIKGNEGLAPTIMFGLGGVFVEIMKDVRFKLAPLSLDDALDMIRSIKGYPVLAGARGEKAVDIDAIAEVLVRLSQLGTDFPEIDEMDVNPLLAFEKGAAVVDARIKIR